MIDKEAFLKAVLPEAKVQVGEGAWVTVRGLSRSEVVGLASLKDDLQGLERSILGLGLVDPQLDSEEIAGWYASAPSGDIDRVVTVISELTGILPESPKSGVPGI